LSWTIRPPLEDLNRGSLPKMEKSFECGAEEGLRDRRRRVGQSILGV
jgi:hypothetical protein